MENKDSENYVNRRCATLSGRKVPAGSSKSIGGTSTPTAVSQRRFERKMQLRHNRRSSCLRGKRRSGAASSRIFPPRYGGRRLG